MYQYRANIRITRHFNLITVPVQGLGNTPEQARRNALDQVAGEKNMELLNSTLTDLGV